MASPPKIAIIGAGPAGLTLARLLHVSKANVDLTIYELDASPTSRPDIGGCLDLHTDTGLAALRKCGLWDSFLKYARYEGEEIVIADKNGTELVHVGGGKKGIGSDRPEIARYQLKEILLESIPAEFVKWGRRLKEVTHDGLLRFHGREELDGPFDLIIGADGAWSKVRGRLTDSKPMYSGVSGYRMDIMEPVRTCPILNARVGRGMYHVSSDRKILGGQRQSDDSITVSTWSFCPEGEAKETLQKYGKKETFEKLLARYADWAPEITDLLRQSDLDSLNHFTLYELPVGLTWEHKKGLTLIGDASSLMTPFAGEGVNKAMKDSLELADLIEKSQDPNADLTLDQAVLLYEQNMFPRARKFQQMTMNNKFSMMSDDAPISTLTTMLKQGASDSSSIFVKMLGTWPIIATLYSYLWIRQNIGLAVRRYWRRT